MLSLFHWQDFRKFGYGCTASSYLDPPGTSAGKAKVPGNFSTRSFRTGAATVQIAMEYLTI